LIFFVLSASFRLKKYLKEELNPMLNQVVAGAGGAQKACCAMMKPKPPFGLRVNGLSLPGFPVTSKETFAIYVKSLLKNPSYKVMGQKPGSNQDLMTIREPKQVDAILDAGGEINICDLVRPLVE
jgi:hypothetical protein